MANPNETVTIYVNENNGRPKFWYQCRDGTTAWGSLMSATWQSRPSSDSNADDKRQKGYDPLCQVSRAAADGVFSKSGIIDSSRSQDVVTIYQALRRQYGDYFDLNPHNPLMQRIDNYLRKFSQGGGPVSPPPANPPSKVEAKALKKELSSWKKAAPKKPDDEASAYSW